MDPSNIKGPVRNIDSEVLKDLALVSNKVFPLPGATFSKGNYSDPRIKLVPSLGMKDKITLYEHIATVRQHKTDMFYVAFRQTMDCLMLEQSDTSKYPKWLMESANKRTELNIFIYQVKMVNGVHVFPSKVANLNSHEDWLQPIVDNSLFETVAYFLLKQSAITIDMFEKI